MWMNEMKIFVSLFFHDREIRNGEVREKLLNHIWLNGSYLVDQSQGITHFNYVRSSLLGMTHLIVS